jgi:hypothetical protein
MIMTMATAALAFNLVCTGTLETKSYFDRRIEPYERTYRMDLGAKKWCEGECKALFDFSDIGATYLILANKTVDTPRERSFSSHQIDRETGAESSLMTSGVRERILILKWDGQCQRAPFSGFPKFETKF